MKTWLHTFSYSYVTFIPRSQDLDIFTVMKLPSHAKLAETREESVPNFSDCVSTVCSKSIIVRNSSEINDGVELYHSERNEKFFS